MFEVISGQRHNMFGIRELTGALTNLQPNGTLYIGYPIIATADDPITIDALLTRLHPFNQINQSNCLPRLISARL